MTRTAEASNWKLIEDKTLYSIITKARAQGKSPGEAYQEASDFFAQMPDFPHREPNAIRQRWGKIKGEATLKELDLCILDPEVPVTTGIQQEINFESGVLMDIENLKEDYPVQEEKVSPLTPVQEKIEVQYDNKKPEVNNGFEQLRRFIDTLEQSHFNLEEQNQEQKEKILELQSNLGDANLEIESLKRELSTFQQVKALLSAGA